MGGRSWIVRSGRKGWWRLHGQIGEHQLGRSCSSSRRVTTFMGETDSFQPSPDVECKLRVSSSRSSKVQARPSNSASMCYKIVWINCTFHLHVQGNAGSFQPKKQTFYVQIGHSKSYHESVHPLDNEPPYPVDVSQSINLVSSLPLIFHSAPIHAYLDSVQLTPIQRWLNQESRRHDQPFTFNRKSHPTQSRTTIQGDLVWYIFITMQRTQRESALYLPSINPIGIPGPDDGLGHRSQCGGGPQPLSPKCLLRPWGSIA